MGLWGIIRYFSCTNWYPYTDDLLKLEACTSRKGENLLQKLSKSSITTPLVWRRWSQALENHPDKAFRDYIVSGLKEGFRIGFKGRKCRPAKTNMKSALEQPQVVSKYLWDKCATGRVVGPLAVNKFRDTDLIISRFGVIPKGSNGKWQMIMDLSFSEGSSVNYGIEADIRSLYYAKVEEATEELVKQGHNSWMAKVDIKSAYRTVPVHPQD